LAALLEAYGMFLFGELKSFFGAASSANCSDETFIGPQRFQNSQTEKQK